MDFYSSSFNLPRRPYATATLNSPSPISTTAPRIPAEYTGSKHSKADSIDSTNILIYGGGLQSAVSSASNVRPGSTKRHSTSSLITESNPTGNGVGLANQHRNTHYASVNQATTELDEAMERLCGASMADTQCVATCTPVISSPTSVEGGEERGYSVHLTGGYQQVMIARGIILRDAPFTKKSVVQVPRGEMLDDQQNIKPEMRQKLDETAMMTKTHLSIIGQVSAANTGESEKNIEIVITGKYEGVEQARVKLLVLLDELSGLHSEICEIDYKLHNIISGRKRCVVQTIQEETATNIYFPTALSGVIGTIDYALLTRQNHIVITGEFFGVQRARDMLFQVSLHKSKCIISRDTAILPRKLDWLLTERVDEIKQIMNDNSTFIGFPAIGSQASLVSIYGDHRVNIERTIRMIMQLACQFYVASFWLLPITFDVFFPPPTINSSQVEPILRHIATTTGVEAVFKNNCFEIHGLEAEVRAAVQIVLVLDLVKSFHHEVKFQVELANEHREFISGKKNGKLNKIAKTAEVKIKFETFNDYNFLVDLSSTSAVAALQGLALLNEEWPAEISFHVPEMYHKRIIGVGGKNIQMIMKEYGVYVKFSNADEYALLGGYNENDDNVVARTPAKNSINLESLKQSVMELIGPKDKDFTTEIVLIPRRYHRVLLGEKAIFIHDIEAKTGCVFRFPNKELASDAVSIYGAEVQNHVASQMLLDHVPFEAEFRLPHSSDFVDLINTQDFNELKESIKRDLNITVLPIVSVDQRETIVRLYLNRSNVDAVASAKESVEDFSMNRNITLYPSLRSRKESADPFPFFASALLSNGSGPDNDLQKDIRSSRPLRMAVSSPNIKALFDAPSKLGHNSNGGVHESIPEQQDSFYSPPSSETTGTSPPRLTPLRQKSYSSISSVGYPASVAHPRLASSSSVHNPANTVNNLNNLNPANIVNNVGQGPNKRGSDPLLGEQVHSQPSIQRSSRSFGHRAQSLDLSSSSSIRTKTTRGFKGGLDESFATLGL